MRRTALAALALLALAGCGSGATSGDSASKAAAPASGRAPAVEGVKQNDQVSVTRAVVRTGGIAVEVKDVADAADRAATIATRRGGHVEDDSRQGGRASMVLRVPTEDVPATLDALGALGHERSRDVSEQDVTEQKVDLASRLATQRTSVARVRKLLERAQSLSDITALEAELTRREADLESLQNRSAALADQVDLATLNVSLVEQAEVRAAAAHGFGDGLRGGWHALQATLRVAGVVLGALLPFAPLVLLALVVVRLVRRRTAAAS